MVLLSKSLCIRCSERQTVPTLFSIEDLALSHGTTVSLALPLSFSIWLPQPFPYHSSIFLLPCLYSPLSSSRISSFSIRTFHIYLPYIFSSAVVSKAPKIPGKGRSALFAQQTQGFLNGIPARKSSTVQSAPRNLWIVNFIYVSRVGSFRRWLDGIRDATESMQRRTTNVKGSLSRSEIRSRGHTVYAYQGSWILECRVVNMRRDRTHSLIKEFPQWT